MTSLNRTFGLISLSLVILLAGCGSGNMIPQGPQQVMVSFTNGTPAALATQIGNSSFSSMSAASQISLSLPSGTTSYAIAYVCPPGAASPGPSIIQASTEDTTSLNINCGTSISTIPTLGTATGSVSSPISGVFAFEIFGTPGLLGSSGPLHAGPFSVELTQGTEDVAAAALDSSNNVLGINILRSQTIPGALNNGNGIVISDATIPQMITVNNAPAGFNPPHVLVFYTTAKGTSFSLTNGVAANPTPYAAIPPAETQPGDSYMYEAGAANGSPSTLQQSVITLETTTSGGGPLTLTLPAPWSFSPPPAALPTFTFNYPGFPGLPFVAYNARLAWQTASGTSSIQMSATAHALNSGATMTIPDLSALPGFAVPAASGTTIVWTAGINGSMTPPFSGPAPSNNSFSLATNLGEYTVP